MSNYFDKFPVVSYNGQPIKNILARARFSENTKNDPSSFIPYRLENSVTRPDLIANAYYDDPYMDWIYYYSNEIVDPYHDTFKESDAFLRHIKDKYGSIDRAQDTVLFYRNNWISEDSGISTYQYENLSSNLKKYYEAVTDYFNNITSYVRKKIDWTVSTNKIRTVAVVSIPTTFVIGDIFLQSYNGAYTAKATLINIDLNTNTLMFNKITGEFVTTNGNTLKGKYDSTGTAQVLTVINPSNVDNIPISESSYWETVSAYDYENEMNEQKRNILLLRNSLKSDADTQLIKLMRI
jgi:hypothetical protein